jgi:hypothetical protein
MGLHPGKDFISADNTPCLSCYATPPGVYPALAPVIGWLSFIPISDRITNGLPCRYHHAARASSRAQMHGQRGVRSNTSDGR